MNMTASFADDEVGVADVQPSGVIITAQGNVITVLGAEGQRVRIFDVVERLLSTEQTVAETQHFRMMATGVYLVQVGDYAAQRVVIRKNAEATKMNKEGSFGKREPSFTAIISII